MGNFNITLTEPQSELFCAKERIVGCVAGMGCLHPNTKIITKNGLIPISDITSPTQVLSWSEKDQKFVFSLSGGSFPKGKGKMYRVVSERGEFVANEHHRIFSSDHVYLQVSNLKVGDRISYFPGHLKTIEEFDHLSSSLDVLNYQKKDEDFLMNYANVARLYGQQFLSDRDTYQSFFPLKGDALKLFQCFCSFFFSQKDDLLEQTQEHIRPDLFSYLLYMLRFFRQRQNQFYASVDQTLRMFLEHILFCPHSTQQFPLMNGYHHNTELYSSVCHSFPSYQPPYKNNITYNKIIHISEEKSNVFYDMQVLNTNNYITEDGSIHHNSGKTNTLLTKCVADLIKYQADIGYFAPTVPLIRDIAYPVFAEIFEDMGMKYSINKSENTIYTGFGKIFCRSMERPENIVGFQLCEAVVDEYDLLPTSKAELALNKIAARIRLKPTNKKYKNEKVNQIFIATTPEGFKATYNLFVKNPLPDSRLITMSTYSNKHNLPKGYIEGLKSQYPPRLIESYLLGKFTNLTSGSVYNFDRDLHVVKQTKPHPTENIHIGQDFNVGKMASVIFVERKNSSGERVWLVIDEIVQGRDTPDTILKIKERYPKNPIFMYPDPAGKNRSTSNFSKSDHTLLRQAGFTIRATNKHPLIKDRVASVNNALSKGKLYVSDGCITVIESLEQQAYDKDGMPEKGSSNTDHCNDALGYFINKVMPVATSIMRYQSVNHI